MVEPHGHADDGDYMCAIAPTCYGPMPGKSKDGTIWFVDTNGGFATYSGGVFKELEGPVIFTTDPNEISKIGDFFCAVANTEWGKIPGKAKDGTCWFCQGEEAKTTTDFQYVGLKKPDPDPVAEAADADAKALCDYGWGPASWYDARTKYFAEAAEKGYAAGYYALGYCCYNGCGGDVDEVEAAKNFNLCAEKGYGYDATNRSAAYKLAYMYMNGRGGLPIDLDKAKEYALTGIKLHCSYECKDLYEQIVQREKDIAVDAEKVKALIEAADGGDAESQFQLAQIYEIGSLALAADQEAGLKYLRLAAEGGLAKAQVYLGNSHDYAKFGLAEDDVAALEWYRRASDQGDEAGSFKVGDFYEHGYGGLEQNEETAKEYYAKGGDAGASAKWRLEEPERNRAELQRLTEAADGGDADVQAELGRVYEYGTLGATADKDKAESLYRAAAGAGSAQGKYYLGLYLIKEVARKHLQEAADLGHSDAAYCINKLSWYF